MKKEYLQYKGKDHFSREKLKHKLDGSEKSIKQTLTDVGLPFATLSLQEGYDRIKEEPVFTPVKDTELWWYDDIGVLCGSSGYVRIRGNEIIEMFRLMVS